MSFREKISVFTFIIACFSASAGTAWFAPAMAGTFIWRIFRTPDTALALYPNARFSFEIGNYYFSDSAYDLRRARLYFLKTLDIAPTFPLGHYQIARIDFLEGNFKEGINAINKEIELHPHIKNSYYVRGLIYGYWGFLKNAENDFKNFLALEPLSWAAHNDLAWIYFALGNYEKAEETARIGLAIHTKNVWLLNARGVALLGLNKKEEAHALFEEALSVADNMTFESWGRAYPGNNIYEQKQGFISMKEAIKRNLARGVNN